MAGGQINLDVYSDALVVLGTAGIVVPLVQRWRVNPVLAYLAAGAILGPLGLGSLQGTFPFLYWLTITDANNVAGIAELGVVFLLFLIGLELSYQRLLTMRRLVFGLGGLQVVTVHGRARRHRRAVRHRRRRVHDPRRMPGPVLHRHRHRDPLQPAPSDDHRGPRELLRSCWPRTWRWCRCCCSYLMLGTRAGGSMLTGLGLALAQAALAIALIVIVGRLLLQADVPPGCRALARPSCSWRRRCSWWSAPAWPPGVAGLSMALGAFVAGLLLAETEFRKAIETTIEPFKGLLLGVFFFTVGMGIDVRELAREPVWLFASVIGLIAHQGRADHGPRPAVPRAPAGRDRDRPAAGPGRRVRLRRHRPGDALGLLTGVVASFVLAVASLTMALIPLLAMAARRIAAAMEKRKPLDPELAVAPPDGETGHAIVVGHGRVGQIVCDCSSGTACPSSPPTTIRPPSAPTAGAAARSTTATPRTRHS